MYFFETHSSPNYVVIKEMNELSSPIYSIIDKQLSDEKTQFHDIHIHADTA